MGVSLLLDEMTETGLAEYCRKLGHDVERENRILVTYDDDFLAGHDTLDRIGVLFQADDRTPPFETANIIDAIADHVDQRQVTESETPFHLSTAWL